MIKRAAGLMMKDRLIIELHGRRERYYRRAEDYFQAGTAYFNLRRYKQAIAACQKSISQYQFLEYYLEITPLVENGLIPEFELEYDTPQYYKLKSINEDKLNILIANQLEMSSKHAVAGVLVEMGVYGRDEAIPIRITVRNK